jgi:HD-like signal output (HDOD) protein
MSSVTTNQSCGVARQLDQLLDDLPTDASVAARVVQMASDERVSVSQLVAVLRQDEALAARLMRLANSAYYGMDRRVPNFEFAVQLVGFQAVRSLALRTAVENQTGPEPTPNILRMRAARQAAAARELAPVLDVPVPDAFAIGLLADVGAVLLWQVDRKFYFNCMREAAGDRNAMLMAQREYYGMDQDQAGAKAFTTWSLPPTMVQALQYPATPTAPVLVRLVALARILADNDLPELTPEIQALSGDKINADNWEKMSQHVIDAAFDIAGKW